MSRLLGAVLAGGRSRRYGSDKALAIHAGQPLIAHAIDAIAGQVDAVVVCGRALAGRCCIPDRPRPDLGPLGGINAGLAHAAANGFDLLLTVGCDTPVLPLDLARRLAALGAPAIVAQLPVIGLWPAALAARLDRHLAADGDRSMRHWARLTGAAALELDEIIPNVNTSADLIRLSGQGHG